VKRCCAQKTRRGTERNRDRDVLVLEEEKGALEGEKYALESESVKYFETKFESYKVFYFETKGVCI
jgi:hypothetical protein